MWPRGVLYCYYTHSGVSSNDSSKHPLCHANVHQARTSSNPTPQKYTYASKILYTEKKTITDNSQNHFITHTPMCYFAMYFFKHTLFVSITGYFLRTTHPRLRCAFMSIMLGMFATRWILGGGEKARGVDETRFL